MALLPLAACRAGVDDSTYAAAPANDVVFAVGDTDCPWCYELAVGDTDCPWCYELAVNDTDCPWCYELAAMEPAVNDTDCPWCYRLRI